MLKLLLLVKLLLVEPLLSQLINGDACLCCRLLLKFDGCKEGFKARDGHQVLSQPRQMRKPPTV